jgi:magnesium transporter
MTKIIKRRSGKAGLPPGSLVHIGEEREGGIKITVMDYDKSTYEEKIVDSVEECFPFKGTATVTWINVDGIHQVEVLEKLGEHFGLHPLVVEDILNTDQRPKMEDFGDYIYIVLRMLYFNEKNKKIDSEQVSLILGPNFVISLQEREGDVFDSIRERIRSGKGRMRKSGPDYLTYALIDAVVDNYFVILEKTGDEIESLEEDVVENPTTGTIHRIHELKREMIFLRKSVWPLREVISVLERLESKLIKDSTRIYLKDVYDHTIQVIDAVESFRDMVAGMLDIYLSSISNRMNEVMKVLTVIATIFIPLTFIAGVYGMNFRYMPELEWRFAYPTVWFVMILIAVLMALYFKKKNWI